MEDHQKSKEQLIAELGDMRKEMNSLNAAAGVRAKMVEQLTEGIVYTDSDYKIVYINQAATDLFGWTLEEITGKHPSIFNANPQEQDIQKDIDRIIFSGNTYFGDTQSIRKDGSTFQCQIKISPIFDDEKEVIGYIQLLRDVTGQNALIKSIIASQKKYYAIMDQANDAIFIADTQSGLLIDANQKAQDLIGYTLQEIKKMHQTQLHPESLREEYIKIFEKHVGEGQSIDYPLYALHKDGRHIPIEINASVLEVDGQVLIQGVFRDMTRQLAAQDRLELQRTALKSAANGIMILDAEKKILWINPAFTKLTGYTMEEAEGKTPDLINSGVHPPEMFEKIWKKIDAGEDWSGQIINKKKNGSVYIDQQTVTPVKNSRGEITHFISIKQDVSKSIQVENDLKRKLAEADLLQRVAMVGATLMDEDEFIETITKMISKSFYSDHLGVLLIDENTQMLYPHPSQIGINPEDYKTRIPLGSGVTGRVAKYGKPIRVKDVKKVKDYIPSLEGLLSELCVPLIVSGKTIGVINVESKTIGAFNEDDERLLLTISSQMATAIERIRLYIEVLHSSLALSMAYDKTLEGWAQALELRDHETQGHSIRVTEMTVNLARQMGIAEEDLIDIQRGALLHDIGKIGIPDSILFKSSTLTEEEWDIMKQHPIYAYNVLEHIPFLITAINIPYCHHERWDGSGYPRGLKGESIPLSARIFSIVDAWDALITSRPYRAAWSMEQTIKHIKNESGKQFDPQVVEAFLEMINKMDFVKKSGFWRGH